MIIAVDGPAGSGKSTVCREIAKRIGLRYVDTGAMYRTVALASLRQNISPNDTPRLVQLAKNIPLELRPFSGGKFEIFLNGEKVTDEIRRPEINQVVSTIACIPGVREEMVKRQRALAKDGYLIMEGRDITTVVLPNADFKFYLDADPSVRVERRFKENKTKGAATTFAGVAEEQTKRDQMDQSRTVSPLRVAEDAVRIDTTGKEVDEVVLIILGKMNVRAGRFNFFYSGARSLLWLIGKTVFSLEIKGVENIPKRGGFIMAANHRSYLDPVVAAVSSKRQLNFLARDTLFRNSFFGPLIKGLNAYPIKRASADRTALRMAAQFIMEGNPILMFPEGTRSADGNFQTPRGGLGYLAARLRCPVVPMHIRGTYEVFPRDSKWPKPGKISARIGEPITWEGQEDNDLYLIITKEIMKKIEALSRLP